MLYIAHCLNVTTSSIIHWIKFRSFPKNKVELELSMVKDKNEFLTRELEKTQRENEKLSRVVIESIK